MFQPGDLVEYQKTLHFVIKNKINSILSICPVDKIELFGSEKEREYSINKNSYDVHENNLKLNTTSRLE